MSRLWRTHTFVPPPAAVAIWPSSCRSIIALGFTDPLSPVRFDEKMLKKTMEIALVLIPPRHHLFKIKRYRRKPDRQGGQGESYQSAFSSLSLFAMESSLFGQVREQRKRSWPSKIRQQSNAMMSEARGQTPEAVACYVSPSCELLAVGDSCPRTKGRIS